MGARTSGRKLSENDQREHANIITLFQFNSRILVENCVVGICNNGMFLEFHEFENEIFGWRI